jgi:sodium/proline symporter
LFGPAGEYGILTIISTLSWGLGYFGMPQVLLRFMAINKSTELKKSRRIATTWCVISLFAAVAIGLQEERCILQDFSRAAALRTYSS